MNLERPDPFRPIGHDLGVARDGAAVRLAAMTPDAAAVLGPGLAAIDPWARVSYAGDAMTRFLSATEPGAVRYAITVDAGVAGALVVRNPWLHGPYLNLIGLLPPFHGRGVGSLALRWMEAEARGRSRNLWLCVSEFNVAARHLYEREGYVLAGRLDSLVFDGLTELLMRKRLA